MDLHKWGDIRMTGRKIDIVLILILVAHVFVRSAIINKATR